MSLMDYKADGATTNMANLEDVNLTIAESVSGHPGRCVFSPATAHWSWVTFHKCGS